MKAIKIILVFALASAALPPSPGEAAGLDYGVKFGYIMSKASPEADSEFWGGTEMTFRKGFTGGVFVDIGLTPGVSIQPEVLFAMKGTGSEMEFEGYDAELTLKMNYIVIPVLLKATIPNAGVVRPVFYAGPSFGMLISDDGELKVSVPPYGSTTADMDFSEAVNSTEFSLVSGAGLEFDLPVGAILLDLRYEYGMTKVIKGGPVSISAGGETITEEAPEDDATYWSIAFTAGYAF